jgi:hypothetical protein
MEKDIRVRVREDEMVDLDILDGKDNNVIFYFFRSRGKRWLVAIDPIHGEYDDIPETSPLIDELNKIVEEIKQDEEFHKKIITSDDQPFLVFTATQTG